MKSERAIFYSGSKARGIGLGKQTPPCLYTAAIMKVVFYGASRKQLPAARAP
jgi:hypothetical protein